MDKKTIAFIVLLVSLVVGQCFAHEAFTVRDCSGSDCNTNITVSVGTLMALLGRSLNVRGANSDDEDEDASGSRTRPKSFEFYKKSKQAATSLDTQFVTDLKGVIRDELSKERTVMIGQELTSGGTYGGRAGGSSCPGMCADNAGSFADAQGKAFLTTAPGKNPNDYIRKDSIPCWGCSVP